LSTFTISSCPKEWHCPELKLTAPGIRVAPVFAGASVVGCCWLLALQDKATKPGILLSSSGAGKPLLFRCCAAITIILFFIGCKFMETILLVLPEGRKLFFSRVGYVKENGVRAKFYPL